MRPIAPTVAAQVCRRSHYRRSYPGGSLLNFGAFAGSDLVGVAVLGVGPANLHRLFQGAQGHQVVCLSRFWLSDSCGRNSESHVLAIILRHLRREQTQLRALVAYSDPAAGHDGAIYRAAGFLFLGRSEAMPFYSVAGAQPVHSRTLSHRAGTRSTKFFAAHGVRVEAVSQVHKLTYVALIDRSWRDRLTRPPLPYPGKAQP